MVNGNSNGFSSNYTLSEDLVGETVRLDCSSNACLAGAKLEWLDGRVPIRNHSLANLRLSRSASSYDTLTLHIHNFSVENYGEYRCRCVKDLSNNDLLSGKSIVYDNLTGLAEFGKKIFCSDHDYNVATLLPSGRTVNKTIGEEFVERPGEIVQLSCDSGNWVVWKANSEPQRTSNDGEYNVSVVTSNDQSKIVCLGQNDTLQKIVYVSIQDYQQLPLEFISPSNGDRNVVMDFNSTEFPTLCALVKPTPTHPQQKRTTIEDFSFTILDGTNKITEIEGASYSFPALNSYHYLEWFWINLPPLPVGHEFRTFTTQSLQAAFYAPNVTVTCTAKSRWEPRITATFRVVRPGMERQWGVMEFYY